MPRASDLEKERLLAIKIKDRCLRILEKNKRRLPKFPQSKSWDVEVHLLNNSKIKRLNLKHRKMNRATDVLSFPNPKIFFNQGALGVICISYPIARKQARQEGHSVRKELEVLITHGILHLLGFDHERSRSESNRMKKAEAFVLSKLGSKKHAGLISRTG